MKDFPAAGAVGGKKRQRKPPEIPLGQTLGQMAENGKTAILETSRTPINAGVRRFPPPPAIPSGALGVQKVRGSNPLGPTIENMVK